MSWYQTGEQAEKKIEKTVADGIERSSTKVFRFWLKPGSNTTITFVDPKIHPKHNFKLPFVYMEHQLFLNNSWRNWYTCLRGSGDGPEKCPLCSSDNQPYLAAAFTVIDHTLWNSKTGITHRDELKLFIAKTKVLQILRNQSAKRSGLRGCKYDINRSDNRTPSTGDNFDFDGKFDLPDTVQPFDYIELLKPLSFEELEGVVGDCQLDADEPIPF